MKPVAFYSPAMVAEVESFSPSARKPKEVVASWKRLEPKLEVRAPDPVTVEQLCLAHERAYVEGVLSLRRPNGFGTRDAAVAASLPYTSGAMLSAARHALDEGVAAAACSGFHHAGHYNAHGFCTFNGLMVTALALLSEGAVRRVGILDCDQHYGDGTEDIIARTGVRDIVRHVTAGRDYPRQAGRFLEALPGIVRGFGGCDVVLYQAGADPHVDDPLGGFLDDAQLARRDAIVFAEARAAALPIAWNLAGGYQEPLARVLDIHDRTMVACAGAWR